MEDGEATASDLAAGERVRPQSMTAILAALDERDLLARRPDPDDGRRQLITLSAAGRDYVDGSRQVREEWLTQVLQDRFTEAERQRIVEALGLLERISAP